MPRVNRDEIFAEDEIQAFHLVNRCVRRTCLCGLDDITGRDYSHRKQWIRDRLEVLAGIFAVDVLSFAVMSNHLHVVARTRPDIVKAWSDDEVALRWWNLFPQRRKKDKSPEEPTEFELNQIRNDASGMKEKRKRLSNVSWLTGHFWEGRFKAQPLLDQTAIAACMVYVDLNPIRAGIAKTPETSDFTSVKERVADRQSSQAVSAVDAQDARIEHGPQAGWLAPVPLDPPRKKVREKLSPRRASNKGCLAMSLDQYLQLLDWTGRQLRSDKRGSLPKGLDPMLERLQCSSETWLDLVKNFRKRFRVEIGLPATLQSVSSLRRTNRKAAQA